MEEPVKKEEQVPVPVKSQPVYDIVASHIFTTTERGIQWTAKFLDISEQQVVDILFDAFGRIEGVFYLGRESKKSSTFETGWFDGGFEPTPAQWASATWEWVDEYNPSP